MFAYHGINDYYFII